MSFGVVFILETSAERAGLTLISPHHRFFHAAVVVHDDQWDVCSELGFATNKVDNFNDLALWFDGQFIARRL